MQSSSLRITFVRAALLAALPLLATACSSQSPSAQAGPTLLSSRVTTGTGYLITPQALSEPTAQPASMLFVADDGKVREIVSPKPN